MALQGNSWSCSCENVWLGRWLRRWMREALQLHTSVVERGQTIRNKLMIFCWQFVVFYLYNYSLNIVVSKILSCDLRAVVRTITCNNTDGSERPLVELDSDTPCHYALGVSSARSLVTSWGSAVLVTIMVIVTLWEGELKPTVSE